MVDKSASKTQPSPKKRSIFDRSIIDHRQLVFTATPKLEPAKDVRVEDVLIQVRDNAKLPIKRYLFTKTNDKVTTGNNQDSIAYPTLFYIPGTAFIANEIKFTHVICSHICSIAKCQIFVINHRLAPEEQFPAGYEDVYDIYKYFVNDMPKFHCIDTNRVVVAGYSSGGNFAALLAIQAKREGLPLMRQVLISPIVDLSRSFKRFKEFENQDTAISEEFVSWFLDLYIPEKEKFNSRNPTMSPFWSQPAELKRLPPTDIILGEYDRFRGDAEYYAGRLQEAGVNTQKYMAKNENHGYLWHNQEVIETIAIRLEEVLRLARIPHLSPVPNYRVLRIEPSLLRKTKQQQDNDSVEQLEIARSKL